MRETETSILEPECYNLGKKSLLFFVNLAKTCTDISLETHENCIGFSMTTKVRIENLSDDLLLVVWPRKKTKGDTQ